MWRRWRRTEGPLAGRFEHAIGHRHGPVQAISLVQTPLFRLSSFRIIPNFTMLSNIFRFPCTTIGGLELFLLLGRGHRKL